MNIDVGRNRIVVTLRFRQDGERVGSIYNDDGTDRNIARLSTAHEGVDFIGVEVPRGFVEEDLDAATELGKSRVKPPLTGIGSGYYDSWARSTTSFTT